MCRRPRDGQKDFKVSEAQIHNPLLVEQLNSHDYRFVAFAMHRVRMLLHFGIKPYIVFDGDNLPSKAETESKRRISRQESRARGLEHLKFRRTSQAFLELRKAVDVTPEMAQMFITELKRANVDYIVAPYEADSQLVYLEKTGIIDGILSEDSDLLVFGANCLLTKLDQYGECVMINRKDFTACTEVSLAGWNDDQFRRMAILNGCDYLQGLNKVGLKTSYRLLRKHKNVENVVRALQLEGSTKVPEGYLAAFEQAERTFLYQWVYCPLQQRLVHFNDLPPHIEDSDLPFIGNHVEKSVAMAVSQGNLNPHTKKHMHRETNIKSFTRATSCKKTIMQTPETKKNHTIESFFKAQRTPLAELDPNSFKPSPSQQGILRDNPHRSWSAEHAPSRAQHLNNAAKTASTGRRVTSEVFPRQLAPSYPFKRQKVFSERTEASNEIATKKELEVSPFFPSVHSASYTESPSIGLGKVSSRTDGPEALLKSDDSIEEALGDVWDANEEFLRPTKKSFKVYGGEAVLFNPRTSADDNVAPDDLQPFEETKDVKEVSTQGNSSIETHQSSEFDTETQATSVFSSHLTEEFADFRSKFSYGGHIIMTDDQEAASKSSSSSSAGNASIHGRQNAGKFTTSTENLQLTSIEVPVSSAPSTDGDSSPKIENKEVSDDDCEISFGESKADNPSVSTRYPAEAVKAQANSRHQAKEVGEDEDEDEEGQEIALETPLGKKFSDFLHHESPVTEAVNVQLGSADQITKTCSVVPNSEDGSGDEDVGDACDGAESVANVVNTNDKATRVYQEQTQEAQADREEKEEEEEEEEAGKEPSAKPLFDLSRFKFAAACAGSI